MPSAAAVLPPPCRSEQFVQAPAPPGAVPKPARHLVHAKAPLRPWVLRPAGQGAHGVAGFASESALPAAQSSHALLPAAPAYEPAAHSWQGVEGLASVSAMPPAHARHCSADAAAYLTTRDGRWSVLGYWGKTMRGAVRNK